MKASSVTLKNVLDYYDGPVLITVVDAVDTTYICELINRVDGFDEFFCVPISQHKLEMFYSGQIDLRSIYENPEIRYFSILKVNNYKDAMSLVYIPEESISSEWYPDEGLKLNAYPVELDASIIKDSRTKNAGIIEARLNPPEARGIENKISSVHLMQFLHLFQAVVRHAFKNSLKNLTKELKKSLDIPENYTLDVNATPAGSFKIQYQITSSFDLFGNFPIESALDIIDKLTLKTDDVEQNLKIIRENRGHFVSSYTNLLKFIIDSDMPVSYSWTTPKKEGVIHRSISTTQALPMYDELNKREELSRTIIDVEGRAFNANEKKNTWAIEAKEDDKTLIYKGTLSENAGCTVTGITIGKTYKVKLEERLETDVSTGKEKTIYSLIDYKEVS